DHREGVRPVPAPGAQQPVDRLAHRGDRPAERAPFGRGIAGIQPVPRDPAAGGAESRVLPARGEEHAALLTLPAVGHQLNVTRNERSDLPTDARRQDEHLVTRRRLPPVARVTVTDARRNRPDSGRSSSMLADTLEYPTPARAARPAPSSDRAAS